MKDQTIYIHKFYKKNQDFQICVAAYFIPLFLTQSASQMLIPNYISIIFVVILLERILSPDWPNLSSYISMSTWNLV